jgi:hypothetical protein
MLAGGIADSLGGASLPESASIVSSSTADTTVASNDLREAMAGRVDPARCQTCGPQR